MLGQRLRRWLSIEPALGNVFHLLVVYRVAVSDLPYLCMFIQTANSAEIDHGCPEKLPEYGSKVGQRLPVMTRSVLRPPEYSTVVKASVHCDASLGL